MSENLIFDLEVDNSQAISQINNFFDAFEKGAKEAGASLDKELGEKKFDITIGLQGGKPVAKEIERATTNATKLEKAAKVVKGEFGNTAKEVNKSVGILREMLANTAKLDAKTGELKGEWKTLKKLLDDAKKAAKDINVGDGAQKSITGANVAANLMTDALYAAGNAVKRFISEGVKMEVLMTQLRGFTGSVEAAEAAFNDFLQIAAATPFNVTQVTSAARTMMGFGVSTGEATKRVEQLAIVAAATGGELTHMARNLGQVQANQRAYTRDLMQFANQGIPIYQMLADVMGVTTQQVREFAEAGQIGYAQVAAALDLMTQKGSAYREIAIEMERTFAARFEAMAGAISATAGKFIEFIQKMDEAAGGLISGSLGFITGTITKIGEGFDFLAEHADALAPLFAALGTAMLATFGIAMVQNIGAITAAIMKMNIAQAAANVLQAIWAALTGNWAAIAAAAAIAATGVIAYKIATSEAAESTDKLNKALQEEQFDARADSAKMLAFQLKDLSREQRKIIEQHKEEFDALQQKMLAQESGMTMALQYLQMEADKRKEHHEEQIEQIKEQEQVLKDNHAEALQREKDRHANAKDSLNEELRILREQHQTKMNDLGGESKYAKELRDIRRGELEAKLRSGGLTRKETLEIKEQLHQMDVRERKARATAEFRESEAALQGQIREEEKRHKGVVDGINGAYKSRSQMLEQHRQMHEMAIEEIDAKYEEQADKVEAYKAEELRMIYENEDAAITALNNQIAKAEELRQKMQQVYNTSKTAQTEAAETNSKSAPHPYLNRDNARTQVASGNLPSNFAGGPIAAGTTSWVNELGKEAFLSASGRLSMINDVNGKWTAPSDGTIIPAHLTKKLDIPSGGININKTAGAGAGVGGAMRTIRAAGGDTFNQSVTVQAANPVQAANNMMVEMTRLKRRKFR